MWTNICVSWIYAPTFSRFVQVECALSQEHACCAHDLLDYLVSVLKCNVMTKSVLKSADVDEILFQDPSLSEICSDPGVLFVARHTNIESPDMASSSRTKEWVDAMPMDSQVRQYRTTKTLNGQQFEVYLVVLSDLPVGVDHRNGNWTVWGCPLLQTRGSLQEFQRCVHFGQVVRKWWGIRVTLDYLQSLKSSFFIYRQVFRAHYCWHLVSFGPLLQPRSCRRHRGASEATHFKGRRSSFRSAQRGVWKSYGRKNSWVQSLFQRDYWRWH